MSYKHCDSVVQSVIESFVERSNIGKKKYNTDLDRTDLSINDWLQHAQEEGPLRFCRAQRAHRARAAASRQGGPRPSIGPTSSWAAQDLT